MALTLREQELLIRFARDKTEVTMTGTGPYWTRQLEKLLARTGGCGESLSADVYRITVPIDRVRLFAPKRQMTLSDEERARRRDILSAARSEYRKSEPEMFDEGEDTP
jgi:hypothetical protein